MSTRQGDTYQGIPDRKLPSYVPIAWKRITDPTALARSFKERSKTLYEVCERQKKKNDPELVL
jgi:hypothetical protein